MSFKRPHSVLVVIFSQNGYVLMLERVQPENFWQSVTGSLRENESEIDAAMREVKEETGLSGNLIETDIENTFPIIPAWRKRYAPSVTHNHEKVFYLALESVCNIRLNQSEHVRYCWLPRDEAADKASSWTNREAILALVPTRV